MSSERVDAIEKLISDAEDCHVGIHISQVPEHAVELLLDEK